MTMIGYARTSTTEQKAGLEAQVRDLQAAISVRAPLHVEEASSVGERPVLDGVLAAVKRGDTLVVTKLDRLARSVANLCEIVELLDKRGAALRILNLGMDTSTPTGKLMLNVLGAVAQFERELMLERQAEGIAKAKGDGKYKGRVATVDHEAIRADFLRRIDTHGMLKHVLASNLAREHGISRRQVYRIVNGK